MSKYISFSNGLQILYEQGYVINQKQANPIFNKKQPLEAKKGKMFWDSFSKGTYVNPNPKKFDKETKKERLLTNKNQ